MGSTFLLRAAALAVGLICAAACGGGGDTHTSTSGAGGNGSGGGGSGGGLMPTGFKCSGAKVSYKTDVAPLFGAHCAGVEGCHLPMHDPQGAYTYLVNVTDPRHECSPEKRQLVVPGDPEHSYAIQKITDANVCSGLPMPKPLTGSNWVKLPDPLIQTIYDWVCDGAKND